MTNKINQALIKARKQWRALAISMVCAMDYCKYDVAMAKLMDAINEIDNATEEAVNGLELELHNVKTERGY